MIIMWAKLLEVQRIPSLSATHIRLVAQCVTLLSAGAASLGCECVALSPVPVHSGA
jgi:hypothetical protein